MASAVNNTSGYIGVAFGAELWSSKVGTFVPDPAYARCAVEFGRVNSVAVMNLSIEFDTASTALTDEINAAYYQDDIVIVIAAGNENGGPVTYPATLASGIAVSSTTVFDAIAAHSSVGPKVEISAPGQSVGTTCLGDSVCAATGTSFAAPHVAAAAALLRAYNGSWSAPEIRRRLAVGAHDLAPSGRDNSFGYGRLDVQAALAAAAPNPPSISIDGPLVVRPFVACVWAASVSGGASPFAYSWSTGGGASGGQSFEFSNTHNHGETFLIQLSVTGADLAQSTTSITVSVSNGAAVCPS